MTGAAPFVNQIVFDCPDARTLGAFWAELLGGRITDDSTEDWVDVEGAGVPLGFQRVADYTAPTWPDGVSQQAHLDLTVSDPMTGHDTVIALGARTLDPVDPPQLGENRSFRVYTDPAGHPFCLCLGGTEQLSN